MTWHEITKLFESLELSLVASLRRNLSKHRADEEKEGFSWSAWQAEKLRSLDAYRKQNKDIMKEYATTIDAVTKALLEEQFAEGKEAVSTEITALTGSVPQAPEGAFFRVNKRAVNSLIKDTNTSFAKAETASLRMLEDVYRKTVERAVLAASTGAVTPRQAIDMATKDFLSAGITCIEYKDGKRVNIASYAEMAIRTAAIRSYMRGEAARRRELGIDTVLVSQYGSCSETCLPWQGRVYLDDVWTTFDGPVVGDHGLSSNGKWYMLLSAAIKGGLFHSNCRHTVSSWIEGISRLPKPLDRDTVRKNAGLEACQRALERKVRKYKRLAEGCIDPENRKRYDEKTEEAQAELRQFVRDNNDVLRRDYWRERAVANGAAEIQTTYSKERPDAADPLSVEQIKEIMNSQLSGLNDAEKDALKRYTGALAAKLNQKLGRGEPLNEILTRYQELLNSALAKGTIPENVTLYRETSWSLLKLPRYQINEEMEILAGRIVTNNIFTSTSFEQLALPLRDTQIIFHVPQGYRGALYIRNLAYPKYREQDEVLFSQGLRWMIKDARLENGRYVIEADVIL